MAGKPSEVLRLEMVAVLCFLALTGNPVSRCVANRNLVTCDRWRVICERRKKECRGTEAMRQGKGGGQNMRKTTEQAVGPASSCFRPDLKVRPPKMRETERAAGSKQGVGSEAAGASGWIPVPEDL